MLVQTFMTTFHLTDTDDEFYWQIEDKELLKFKTGRIYNLFQRHEPEVPWGRIVWNRSGIPKHSFLTWLAVLNRLPTRDRLLSWGLAVDPSCVLCSGGTESRNHLLFECTYSWNLWSASAARCDFHPTASDWTSTLSTLQAIHLPSWKTRLLLLVWQLVIYSIWYERNTRIHRLTFRSTDSVLSMIDRTVRNRIQALRESNPQLSSQMIQAWL